MNCDYKTLKRVGDITLGDFIGLGRNTPFDFVDGVNPSLVFVNTEIGTKQINKIKNVGVFISRATEEAVMGGPSLKSEKLSSNARKIFRKRYARGDFVSATAGLEFIMAISMHTDKLKTLCIQGKNKIAKITRRSGM